MRSRAERHAGFKTLVQAVDRHFQFDRVVHSPDVELIRSDVIVLARELRRLGLDTLDGCKAVPNMASCLKQQPGPTRTKPLTGP